ncbi:hypothetical protein HMPREF1986_00805 [Oribacterium sp. oral taxon 078 str. F0263]|nr:hypothetical protein GCWU000341_02429 [Oribacterium sp. oral taxon 078 str. F0262]ERL22199.1 hypothetical protein HMPREF1986_00805 [Oribacterium sp. oral taxon 078 str. F0263]
MNPQGLVTIDRSRDCALSFPPESPVFVAGKKREETLSARRNAI